MSFVENIVIYLVEECILKFDVNLVEIDQFLGSETPSQILI